MIITEQTVMKDFVASIGWEDRPFLVDPLTAWTAAELKERLGSDFGKETSEELTIEEFGRILTAWNRDSMIAGLEHLQLQCQKEQVLYPLGEDSYLMAFPAEKQSKCVIICPGGGYFNVCSLGEGFPVARALNAMGIGAFVVHYRANTKAAAPNPMDDLAAAVRFVRDHREKFHVDMTDYAVLGFSAGGHLAASFGTASLGYARYNLPSPSCMLLGYPVVTMGQFTHEGSRENLLGRNASETLTDHYSIEKQVDAHYPRTFLWQCDQDGTVPIENSRMLSQALAQYSVPCTYEVFPGAAHGWGLGVGTAAEGWLERGVRMWLGK